MTDPSKTVERVSDPAFSIDEDLCITGWNERLEELTGYSSEEVLGQTCDEILQAQLPGGAPLCRADCKGHECLVAGKPFEVSACQLKAKNGRLIDAEFGSVVMETGPDRGAEGQELAVILVRNRESAKSIQNSERLQIHTLGDIELLFDDQPIAIENWKRKQAITLLKVLAVSDGGTIHRERLAAILWPDADGEKGWERLRVTIYALRKELKAAGLADPIVETVDRSYRLKSENVWIDFQAFEASMMRAARLRRKVTLKKLSSVLRLRKSSIEVTSWPVISMWIGVLKKESSFANSILRFLQVWFVVMRGNRNLPRPLKPVEQLWYQIHAVRVFFRASLEIW